MSITTTTPQDTAGPPEPPDGMKDSGVKLWNSIVQSFDLEEHELALLRQAALTADLLDALQADVESRGPTVESPQGLKANPAAVEIRQQRLVLARLIAALRMPSGDESERPGRQSRPQRRTGVRGTYRTGWVS